jgi:hypothetical protein
MKTQASYQIAVLTLAVMRKKAITFLEILIDCHISHYIPSLNDKKRWIALLYFTSLQ